MEVEKKTFSKGKFVKSNKPNLLIVVAAKARRQAITVWNGLLHKPFWRDVIREQDPIIVGGQGGSATRLVAEILIKSRRISILPSSWESKDPWSLRKCELNEPRLILELLREARTLNYQVDSIRPELRMRIQRAFDQFIENICREGRVSQSEIWGWKEPRAMYYLPFWHQWFPKFKFIHVVRDVRGIKRKRIEMRPDFYTAYFGKDLPPSDPRQRFKTLWASLNLGVQQWAKAHIPSRYYLLQVEKLTRDPLQAAGEIQRLFQFLGISGVRSQKLSKLSKKLKGYSKSQESEVVSQALRDFGYLDQSV